MPREDEELNDDEILGQDFEDESEGEEDGADEGESETDQGEQGRLEGRDRQEENEDVLARETPRQSRASRRIQALTDTARQAEERAQRAERRVQEFMDEQRARQEREDPAREQERLALMTPEERMEYRFNQAEQRHQRERAEDRARQANVADQTNYRMRAATNAIYRKYEDEVEKTHQDLRSQGQHVAREAILKFMLGAKMLERAERDAPKQRQRGKENIRRQTTKPVGGRQDVQAERRRTGSTPAERLEGVVF